MTPNEKQISSGAFKEINGVWHRRCAGPSHDQPTFLPATEKFFYIHRSGRKSGLLTTRCRLCSNWSKLKVKPEGGSEHGLVPIANARPVFQEAINRCGLMELSRRTGVSTSTIENVLRSEYDHVRRRTVKKVMLELISMKRKREFPISNQARWRVNRRISGYEREYCPECGTEKGNYTAGCKTCLGRQYDRERRVRS